MTQITEPDQAASQEMAALGAGLRAARALVALKQRDIAEMCGVSCGVVSRAEAGESITTDNLFRILWALGASLPDVCLKPRGARR